MTRAEAKTGLLEDFERLYVSGSSDDTIKECETVLSRAPVQIALAEGASKSDAGRALLEMVGELGVERQERYVRCGAAITGVRPRSTGRGVRNEPGPKERKEAAGKEDYDGAAAGNRTRGIGPKAAGDKRKPVYYPAYAEAVLKFEEEAARNKELLAEFLRRCGVSEDALTRLIEPEPAGVTGGRIVSVDMLGDDAAGSTAADTDIDSDAGPRDPTHDGIGRGYRKGRWQPRRYALIAAANRCGRVLKLMLTKGELEVYIALLTLWVPPLLMPASTWRPIQLSRDLLLASPATPAVIIALLLALRFLILRRLPGLWVRTLVPFAIVVVSFVMSIVYLIRYDVETRYATSIKESALDGSNVLALDFTGSGACPSESAGLTDRDAPRPTFTACRLDGGALHAVLTTRGAGAAGLGIFPTSSHHFLTKTDYPSRPLSYYIETRFRAVDRAQLSACGLWVEGRHFSGIRPLREGRVMFVHIRPGSTPSDSFVGEVLATTPFYSNYFLNLVSNSQLARGAVGLPFVGNPSLPGWEYGTWTKLAVVLTGDRLTMLVNDRVALTYTVLGLDNVDRVSVAIEAGGEQAAGTAACDFDYLHVRSLREPA
jgi:hypothetical protein